eukprot:5793898-Prorocentrum_lima.AAC.1
MSYEKRGEQTRDKPHTRMHVGPVAACAQVFCSFSSSLTPNSSRLSRLPRRPRQVACGYTASSLS